MRMAPISSSICPRASTSCRSRRPGFQKFEQTVSLETGARSRLDLSLAVGSIGETVTVAGRHAAGEHRERRRSERSSTARRSTSCRSPSATGTTCCRWCPGVQSDRYTEQSGGTASGRTGGVNVHGNRSLQNNFLLDGVANNSFSTNVQELTTQISRPSVDAIDEFKVVTSPYAAEYGWSPGAAIIVNTKSGTNTIRGTVYDFFRNDKLDSNNFFAKRGESAEADEQPEPVRRQRRRADRPESRVLLRRLRRARASSRACSRTGRVLTADERRGVFTSAIRDPLTGQPFANNTIPANRIDPVAARIARAAAAAERGRRQQLHQPARTSRTKSSGISARVDLPSGQRQHVRPLHLHRSVPLRPGLVRRHHRRHVDLGLGPQLPEVACGSCSAGPRCSAATPRERGALLVRARHQRRHAGSVRRGRQRADRRSAACRTIRRIVGGIVGIDIAGHIRARIAELHAEVPAHRAVPVPRHADLAEGHGIRSSSAPTSCCR